jgi:lysozyme
MKKKNAPEKSQIIPLLEFEEGTELSPYLDSLGYPSTGTGFKLGPKGAPLSHYTFIITQDVNDVWLQSLVDVTLSQMSKDSVVSSALEHCNQPRKDILTSMSYQMGESGLDGFHDALAAMTAENWDEAATQMLDSTWATQTPERAQRHADVMRSGEWKPTYNF